MDTHTHTYQQEEKGRNRYDILRVKKTIINIILLISLSLLLLWNIYPEFVKFCDLVIAINIAAAYQLLPVNITVANLKGPQG